MQITHLSLTDFRNYARLDVNIPTGATMLIGGNAQGKTSLLEAIYYLATFTSFQASHDRQLINFLKGSKPFPVSRIVAQFRRTEPVSESQTTTGIYYDPTRFPPGEHQFEIRLFLKPNINNHNKRLHKEIFLDGVKCKTADAVGAFNAVLFLPQMLRIVEGPPDQRRKYINLLLVQVMPEYARYLSEYNRNLTQRNALLKQLSERGGDVSQLDYWDDQISILAAKIIHARINAFQSLERLSARIHGDLSHGTEILRINYLPAYEPLPSNPEQINLPIDTPLDRSGLSVENIQEGFQESLLQIRNEEILRGVTTIGPHRDEFRLIGNGIDLGTFGSRGQARTAVLSLKLAEVSWMKVKTGQWPVLLLDEVLAELDPDRRFDLLERLSDSEQTLLTTTDLDLFNDKFISRATHWKIESGQVEEVFPGE